MKCSVGLGKDGAEERLFGRGISRRDFMKFCTTVAAIMGMGPAFAPKVAEALTAKKRPSVIWINNAECTGCTEALLRTVDPVYIDELILDTISLDYHETIMQASGHAAEEALEEAMNSPEGYILVMEGAIPTGDGGVYGKIGGKTMLDLGKELSANASAIIAMGACSCFGGIQAAEPNPTGSKSTSEALGVQTINIAGCPPNPYNFVGTVVHLLTKGMPAVDEYNRPIMFFGETVHDRCERLPHFDNGEFAPSFGSEEARKGWCLYELGCKGPYTYNNCPTVKFNQVNWPVQAGHPCIGCSEPKFWDWMTPFYEPS
ncbi:MAG: hydrogenase small subunit [Desulfovibrionales bacterium]